MCLTIKSGVTTSEVASKDILVWKVLCNAKCGDNTSEHQNFQYTVNHLYRTEMVVGIMPTCRGRNGYYYVTQGFHAFTSKNVARMRRGNIFLDRTCYKIVKFIIPKGSRYYIGTDGDIVSDQIRSGDLKHCR